MLPNNSLEAVIATVKLLVAERHELNAQGPHFRITHRFHIPETDCLPGEEITAIHAVHRSHEYHLRLSLAQRLLFDYLARHPHLPQSALQIEAGIQGDAFYTDHASNVFKRGRMSRGLTRSAVKEYIKRLRMELDRMFQEINFPLPSHKVLVACTSSSNEVVFSLRGSCEWIHVDLRRR